jgi:hypothetical protein
VGAVDTRLTLIDDLVLWLTETYDVEEISVGGEDETGVVVSVVLHPDGIEATGEDEIERL